MALNESARGEMVEIFHFAIQSSLSFVPMSYRVAIGDQSMTLGGKECQLTESATGTWDSILVTRGAGVVLSTDPEHYILELLTSRRWKSTLWEQLSKLAEIAVWCVR